MVSLVLWKWMKVNSDEEHPEASVKPAAIWDAPPPEVPPAVVEKYRAQIDRQLENE
jgi:hypothetical protein